MWGEHASCHRHELLNMRFVLVVQHHLHVTLQFVWELGLRLRLRTGTMNRVGYEMEGASAFHLISNWVVLARWNALVMR